MQTNTYQAVIISNVTQTFAVFAYLCGGVEWSAVGSGRAAVQGYNEAGNHFFNHRLSGYLAIGDAVSCISKQGKKRKRAIDDSDPICIPVRPELNLLIRTCKQLEIFNVDILFIGLDRSVSDSLNEIAKLLPSCPRTRMQADLSSAVFRPQPDLNKSQCYVSIVPVPVRNLIQAKEVNVTQQCCYNGK